MARYKMANALRHCDPEEFKTDKAAWNKLQLQVVTSGFGKK